MLNTIAFSAVITGCLAAGPATRPAASFNDAKTCFQTNVPYDPRIAIAVDAVIVHRHGEHARRWLKGPIGSWKQQGFTVGRMFFADSDADQRVLDSGKWDGTPHPEDVERNAARRAGAVRGHPPVHAADRGLDRATSRRWHDQSIEAGADAILPEEPLAHVDTGYEEAFKPICERSATACPGSRRSLARGPLPDRAAQERAVRELERRLARRHQASRPARSDREIAFVLPVHALYSNVAATGGPAGHVAATSADIDGYIGQIWTGPVNWALANYDSPDKSFFASAYALYDYFVQLTAGSDKRLWLLVDPVEDDPNHNWAEFEEWYRHCLSAKLMFPEVDPVRGHALAGPHLPARLRHGRQTPAPERFRIECCRPSRSSRRYRRAGNGAMRRVGENLKSQILKSQIQNRRTPRHPQEARRPTAHPNPSTPSSASPSRTASCGSCRPGRACRGSTACCSR